MQSENNQKHRHQKQSSNTHFPGALPRSIPRIKPQLLLGAALRRLRVGLSQVTRALLRQLSRCAHSTRSQMAPRATCPRSSQFPTPPRRSAHLRVRARARTHTHTHTHTHVSTHTLAPAPPRRRAPTRRTRPGLSEVGGAGNRGRRAPRPNSSRQPESLKTQRPRRLPFGGEASGPFTATVSPEPRNLNRGRRGGRGGSSF